jgi:hypothetical protein
MPTEHQQDMDTNTLQHSINSILYSAADDYDILNTLRSWVNENVFDVELYLEDVWNEYVPGETWIEYILRSLNTKNETDRLGYDVYKNHQDAKGVWHLDEYVKTVRLIQNADALVAFISANAKQPL